MYDAILFDGAMFLDASFDGEEKAGFGGVIGNMVFITVRQTYQYQFWENT